MRAKAEAQEEEDAAEVQVGAAPGPGAPDRRSRRSAAGSWQRGSTGAVPGPVPRSVTAPVPPIKLGCVRWTRRGAAGGGRGGGGRAGTVGGGRGGTGHRVPGGGAVRRSPRWRRAGPGALRTGTEGWGRYRGAAERGPGGAAPGRRRAAVTSRTGKRSASPARHAGKAPGACSGSPRKHHRALPARRRAAAGRGRSLLALEDPRGGRERCPEAGGPRGGEDARPRRLQQRRRRRRGGRQRGRHLPRLSAQRLQAGQALPLPAPRHQRGDQPGRAQERVHLLPRLPEQGVRAPQLPLHPRHQGGRGLLQEDGGAAPAPAAEGGRRARPLPRRPAQQQGGGAHLQGLLEGRLPAGRQVQVPAPAAGLRVRVAGDGRPRAGHRHRRAPLRRHVRLGPLRRPRARAEAAAGGRAALRHLRVQLHQPADGGVPAAGGGEHHAAQARGGPQEAGEQPDGDQRGAAGAERPVPQPGQGDDSELHRHGHRADSGAHRGHRHQLQPQHRADPHHAQQPGPAAPARFPTGFGSARRRPGSAPGQRRSPHEPRNHPALGRPGADHCPGHGPPGLHGPGGRLGGSGGRVDGAAAGGHYHEPRHHPHGDVPHRLAEHADNGHAALTSRPRCAARPPRGGEGRRRAGAEPRCGTEKLGGPPSPGSGGPQEGGALPRPTGGWPRPPLTPSSRVRASAWRRIQGSGG